QVKTQPSASAAIWLHAYMPHPSEHCCPATPGTHLPETDCCRASQQSADHSWPVSKRSDPHSESLHLPDPLPATCMLPDWLAENPHQPVWFHTNHSLSASN